MSCEHLIYKPTDQAHVLPCRHKFCIPCTENIHGLMESEIFSCPVCGGYSQYVDPHRSVFGEEKLPVNEDESMDYNASSGNMPETAQLQADSCEGATTNRGRRPMSDRADCRDPDRDIDVWMAKSGVHKQAFEIEQREAWENIEKDKLDRQYKRHSTTPSGTSQTFQVATVATNDDRRRPSDPGSDSFRNDHNSEQRGDYDNLNDNMEKEHASPRGKPNNGYNAEGRCLVHDRFIAFACTECNSLLCQLCKSVHAQLYYTHTVSRLTDETDEDESRNGPPKMSLNSKEGAEASVSNDQNCKHHSKPFIMYCKSCKRVLCKACLDSHSGLFHSYNTLSIRDMKQSMNAKFKEHLDTIDSLKQKLQTVSKTVEHNVAYLLEEADTVKDNVTKATDEAIKQLRENQELMLKQIESGVKMKTAKYEKCAEKTNKMTETLTTIEEAAQGAFRTVDDSNFPMAQIVEQDVSRNIGQLERECKIYEPQAPEEKLELQCEVKRIAKYWEYQGDKSEAPVRLIKPPTSFGRSIFF